jgi:hypothetical protein
LNEATRKPYEIICNMRISQQICQWIRYPHKYEVNENDANFSIAAVEKIKELEPIIEIYNEIINRLV